MGAILNLLKRIRQPYRRAMQKLFFERIIHNFRNMGPIEDTKTIFDTGARGSFGIISPIQARNELVPLLDILKAEAPKIVMDIGTAQGGTLFMFTRVADPQATLISLDLPGGAFGGG